ncbi:hypothetical protein X474_17170 [Dethiosulfatarculus sandiegensis]|uniref:Uncharacterized protein n=1 Tax=Dethiosulfatarculus sandiegensis TaxID=1429043 RepID=A0A0D2JTK0_9BACT|nr:hypothetical protein X474_17170 [Dethiosulfatarculus sandiegensis]
MASPTARVLVSGFYPNGVSEFTSLGFPETVCDEYGFTAGNPDNHII